MAATAESAAVSSPKSRGSLKWAMALLLSSGIAAGGAWWHTKENTAAAAPATQQPDAAATKQAAASTPPKFVSMGPAFVVNLAGDDALRYLQVNVQVVTRSNTVAKAIDALQPSLRNRLLLLFSSQHATNLVSRNGKEKLQAEALTAVRKSLKQFHVTGAVSAVIFTSFVMQ